jgi:capsular exopolysaccharide synthesis family protein
MADQRNNPIKPHLPNPLSNASEDHTVDAGHLAPRKVTAMAAGDLFGPDVAPSNAVANAPSLLAVLRYKWQVLLTTLFVAAAAIPAIWVFVVPLYEAHAVVRVSPIGARIVFSTEDNGMVPLYQSFLNSQVSIIRSTPVMQRVLENSKTQATEWYRDSPRSIFGAPLSTMERLLDNLVVTPRRTTELIDVAMVTPNARDAKIIADIVVDEFRRYSEEVLEQAEIARLETLQEEKRILKGEIDGLVATKSNIAAMVGSADPAERLAQASAQLTKLETDQEALSRSLALTQWELSQLPVEVIGAAQRSEDDAVVNAEGGISQDSDGDARRDTPEVRRRYSEDAEWRKVHITVSDARNELELARLQYGPSHPRIAALSKGIEHAESVLKERESQLDAQWEGTTTGATYATAPGDSSHDPRALERRAKQLSREIELLDEVIRRQRGKVSDLGQIMKDMSHYDEELRHDRETYAMIRSRLEQLTLEQKAPARISVAGYAVKASRPSKDRRLLLTAMALFGALAAGLGLGYLRALFDPTMREMRDVSQANAGPFLGQIPTLPANRDILSSCSQAIIEDVRRVRTALLERVNGIGGATVIVTSSYSQAGKTSVSILLAQSLAILGKRTLLVEADLRRPSLSGRLNVSSSAGLMSVLTEARSDDRAVVSAKSFKFDVILAGDRPAGFTLELFANGAMAEALSRWKKKYDIVLLDCPPVLPVADVRILGGLCNGAIMVVRAAHCRREGITQAYANLAAGGCCLMGTILVGGIRGSNYASYDYAYQESERSVSQLPQLDADLQDKARL